MASLNNEQILELQKLQSMVAHLEKIFKNSKNPEQQERVSKDLRKYREKILAISPEGIPETVSTVSKSGFEKMEDKGDGVLANIPILRLSPHCNDHELNFVSTLISIMDTEYVPILADKHVKLDFSQTGPRDGLLKQMENLRRNVKVLTETVEEYDLSDKQDFKEQLGRMKNKQSRIFLSEASETLKKFKEFLEKILKDMGGPVGSSAVMNPDEKIHFNPRFEKATSLEGLDVRVALDQFFEFTKAALDKVNIPTVKK